MIEDVSFDQMENEGQKDEGHNIVPYSVIFQIQFSMIYKAAPAWSFKGKSKSPPLLESPSPLTYSPEVSTTLAKTPSWKVGKEIREKNKQQKSPSPASYDPPTVQKNKQMGIIGKEVRGKENRNNSPGPGSYHIPFPKQTSSISFASKYEFKNKTLGFPGPGNYQIPQKKQKRGASIGRQTRFTDIYSDKRSNPGPGSYNYSRPSSANVRFTKAPRMSHESINAVGRQYEIKGEFQSSGKGFSLRSKHQTSHGDLTPGPSSYSPTHFDLTSSPSLSFSKKYKVKEADRSPSPNQYDPQYQKIFFKTESYSVAKAERQPLYGNCKSPGPGAYLSTEYTNNGVQMSLGMSRKIEEREDFPGPGAYDPNKQSIQKRPQTAKIGTSKRFYKIQTEACPSFYDSKTDTNSPKYSFTKKKKLNDKNLEGPGPGAYNIPSSLCNIYPFTSCKR